MKRLQLVPEWRSAWRMASVIVALLLALLSAVQAEVLPVLQPVFAPEQWPWVSGGMALLIIVLRLIKQQLPGQRDTDGGDGYTPPPDAFGTDVDWPRSGPRDDQSAL